MSKKGKNSNYITEDTPLKKTIRKYKEVRNIESRISIKGMKMDFLKDCTPARDKRAYAAIEKLFPEFTKIAEDVCHGLLKDGKVYEQWGIYLAANSASYDFLDKVHYMSSAAAIWIIDRLCEQDTLLKTLRGLHVDIDAAWDSTDAPYFGIPGIDYDSFTQLLYLISCRNEESGADIDPHTHRIFLPDEIVTGKPIVRGRNREDFDHIIKMIPEEKISAAVAHFKDTFWKWVRIRFQAAEQIQIRADEVLAESDEIYKVIQDLDKRLDTYLDSLEKENAGLVSGSIDPQDFTHSQVLTEYSRLLKRHEELEKKYDETFDRFLDICKLVDSVLVDTGLISKTRETLRENYAAAFDDPGTLEEIVESLISFDPGDPYEMCFALLYMCDTQDDLVWLFGPCVSMIEEATALLPWYGGSFDEIEEDTWKPDAEMPVDDDPDLMPMPDFSSMDYTYSEEDGSKRTNLARIIYRLTGAIIPRNFHRTDNTLKALKDYGITGKAAIPYQYLLPVLSEYMHEINYYDADKYEDNPDCEDGGETIDDLKKMIEELRHDNMQLRQNAHDAIRESRTVKKKLDGILAEHEDDKKELAVLREIVFNAENNMESEPVHDETVEYPYEITERTVVFGGHETWLNAIKPLLTGDIRFIGREANFSENIIRNADVVWIQTNGIGHAAYYRIIGICRTHHIHVEYFMYASAEKCAAQVVNAAAVHTDT